MSDETQTYSVIGMSCEHCRAAVSEEVAELEGVSEVSVDLARGELQLRGDGVDPERVRAAVEDAGYELGDRR